MLAYKNFDPIKKKKVNSGIFLAILLIVTLIAMIITEYDIVDGFTSVPKAIVWAMSNFYPNIHVMEKLPKILQYLGQTVFLAITSSTVASIFAMICAFFGSETTRVNKFIGVLSRAIASLFRNIPVVAWAMILLFSFGQSSMTGFLALFFVTFGFLTRAFMETIDEVSSEAVEALRATGANWWQVVFQAVLPASLPQMISWVLFMIETNIRSSTLVGILTGTGIGFIFELYYKAFHYEYNYNAASLVVICIVLTVFVIEIISNYVRRVIL